MWCFVCMGSFYLLKSMEDWTRYKLLNHLGSLSYGWELGAGHSHEESSWIGVLGMFLVVVELVRGEPLLDLGKIAVIW